MILTKWFMMNHDILNTYHCFFYGKQLMTSRYYHLYNKSFLCTTTVSLCSFPVNIAIHNDVALHEDLLLLCHMSTLGWGSLVPLNLVMLVNCFKSTKTTLR